MDTQALSQFLCSPTWIRTRTDRTKICCAAVTQWDCLSRGAKVSCFFKFPKTFYLLLHIFYCHTNRYKTTKTRARAEAITTPFTAK